MTDSLLTVGYSGENTSQVCPPSRETTKRPDLTLTWPTAEEFFKQVAVGTRKDDPPDQSGNESLWKFAQPVYSAFCAALREVLLDPVDENGVRLA